MLMLNWKITKPFCQMVQITTRMMQVLMALASNGRKANGMIGSDVSGYHAYIQKYDTPFAWRTQVSYRLKHMVYSRILMLA